MGNFKKLRVWKDSIELAQEIYEVSRKKPFSNDYGLCNQIRRAVVSIPSNIAEGDERGSNRQSAYFFFVAKGSAAEVITQLCIAYRIGYLDMKAYRSLELKAEKIRASLRKLIKVRERDGRRS